MSGFFGKIKDAFGSKKIPKYKVFQPNELKMIALKARIILEKNMEQLLQTISKQDQTFKYVGQDPNKIYNILQSIGDKIIEAQSIKIFIEMMRKIQNNCANIVKTNGDISLMKTELKWFQCVLWYRMSKEVTNLDQIYNFCLDFFKGVDITVELGVKCQVFQLYPILKYLKKGYILPIPEILFYLQPYVSCNISQPTLDAVFDINKQQINQINQGQRQSVNNKPQQPSKIYPNSSSFTIDQPRPQSSNPYNKQQQSNIGNYVNASQMKLNNNQFNNPVQNSQYNQFNNPIQNSQYNPYSQQYNAYNQPYNNQFTHNQPANTNNSYNTMNYSTQQLNYNQPSNQDIQQNYIPPNNYNQNTPTFEVDHNPFLNSKFGNPQNNNPINVYSPEKQKNIRQSFEKQQIIPVQPLPQKKSFFNSLMRANSRQQPKQQLINQIKPAQINPIDQIEQAVFILPDPLNNNYNEQRQNSPRDREQNDYQHQQVHGSQYYLNRESKQGFSNGNYKNKIKEWEEKEKKRKIQEQKLRIKRQEEDIQRLKRIEEEKIRKIQQRKRIQQQKKQAQQRQLREEKLVKQQQRKLREYQANVEQQRKLKEEKQEKQAQQRKLREEQQQKQKIQRQIIQRQNAQIARKLQEERLIREQEQRKQKEQEERQTQRLKRIQERQRQWLEQRQKQDQLNVFIDNEREEVDRGQSGRFSTNMGFKVDFGEEQGEEFIQSSVQVMNSSILRFKEDKLAQKQPVQKMDYQSIDERDSLDIIHKYKNDNSLDKPFKLFYYKKIEKTG